MILLVAEQSGGVVRKSALELVAVGRRLAAGNSEPVEALVVGPGAEAAAAELAQYVAKVHVVSAEQLGQSLAEPMTRAVAHASQVLGASLALATASRFGLSFTPRVAVRMGAPLLEDIVAIDWDGPELVATRLGYLARVNEVLSAHPPAVITVKPGAFPAAEPNNESLGQITALQVPFEPLDSRVQVLERGTNGGRLPLEDANVVVTGGRGLGNPENFERLVEGLARRLGAGVGATRAVVDAGWRPYEEQVGQTGKTVAPSVYFALGVSGAVQHLSGMNRSKVVVAVNRDAGAPIFKISDYGIVGDVTEVVPAIEAAVERLNGG